jgi:acetyl esterase/lipase
MKPKYWMMASVLAATLCMNASDAFAQPASGGRGERGAYSSLPESIQVEKDIPYAGTTNWRQSLDLLLPKAKAGGKPLPIIVAIHGGAFMMGDKSAALGDIAGLVASGDYAGASINYRLSGEAIWPAQIQDCKAAIRWIRANAAKYNIDPNRIGAIGSSAGGHLVAMLGVTGSVAEFDTPANSGVSSRVQAVADYYGPTDFLQMDAHRTPNGQLHNPADSPESKLVGGAIQENTDKTAKANPITYIAKDAPPFLIFHGDADPLVPHHQSELLEAALKKAGVPVTFYTVKGAGHGGFKDPKIPEMTKSFFAKHLKTKSMDGPE